MGTRTVRLDEEAERLLADVTQTTGMNVTQALRTGLTLLRQQVKEEAASRPYEIYRSLPLGEGGYACAPARDAKRAIREVLRETKVIWYVKCESVNCMQLP